MKGTTLFCALFSVVLCIGTVHAKPKGKDSNMTEGLAKKVIAEYVAKYEPLDLKHREAWYKYNTTGDKKFSDIQARLELEIRLLNSDKDRFESLKGLYKNRVDIEDPIVRRQIELIYLSHLPNQASKGQLKKMTELSQRIEQVYNDYRPVVDGRELTPVDTSHILLESTDSAKLEKVWKGAKLLGAKVEADFRELVKLRNEIARGLGYKDAVVLNAEVAELDLKMLDRFYDDVHKYTQRPFEKLKRDYIDPRLAKRYGIGVSDLRPWHYQNQFFQEAPTAIFEQVDLDELYKEVDSNDIIKQTEGFYASMGVDVGGIIRNSSLFPKPGKNPHAFAEMLNPNKPGTSVLLMNLPTPPAHPKAGDASTLVHELAHDINYESVSMNKALPYLLKDPTMLTEAVAMLFEEQTRTADWFARLGVPAAKAGEAASGVELVSYVDQLIFLRWASTIYCFERQFYANPAGDIGDLWWECKATHQLLVRPEGWKNPDALAKYHIPNIPPLYYSNYAIGRVANVQFADLVAEKAGKEPRGISFFGLKGLGDWLMGDFLAQGERYRWDEFIKYSTGKKLSVKPWKKFYIDSDFEERLFRQ